MKLSYTINSYELAATVVPAPTDNDPNAVTEEDRGVASVTIVIGDGDQARGYVQELSNLPTDPAELRATLEAYARDYLAGVQAVLAPPPAPTDVAKLVGQSVEL